MNLLTKAIRTIDYRQHPRIFQAITAGSAGIILSTIGITAFAAEGSAIEEVVVTSAATRLTSGFESPKPKTTVDRAMLDNRGITNIADYLNEIPAFTATATPAASTLSSTSVGVNHLNLRSLGPNRTLVLVDRRRYVPTLQDGTTDINIIPQTIVEQVEVVTGGASAQWGSDAVAGVVNLKLNRNFEGFKIDTRVGQSSEGDGEEEFISFAVGSNIAEGRGHIGFAAEYQDNKGIGDQIDRDWGRDAWGIVDNPADTGPNDGIPARIVVKDVKMGLGTPGGYLPLALGNHPSLAQMQFGPNGELLPYDQGVYPIPDAFATLPFQVGGDGGSLGATTGLQPALDRKSFVVTLDYDINDSVRAFFDVSYGEAQGKNETVQPWSFIGGGPDVIAADNAFIPEPVLQIMSDNNVPVLVLARTNDDHGFITSEVQVETLRFAAGFQGEINSNWSWDAYISSGDTDRVTYQHDNVIKANRNFAIDAVVDPGSGEIVCRANLGGANGAPGCVPLNLFGDGAPSQSALDYIHGVTIVKTTMSQDVYAASVSGELFDLPAGPLSIAFGAEYREESATVDPDKIAENDGYFITNGEGLSGEFDVKEAFLEIGAPIFETDSGMSLDLNGAARYTEYSSSGSANTWSFGAIFTPYQDLTIRGSVSRDIRAPNIGELFAAGNLSFNNLVHPTSGLINLSQIKLGGNSNLDVEEAETQTFGVVFQPSWLNTFSLSLDWYNIEVNDAISTLPAQTIVDICFSSRVGCENVTESGGIITSVNATFLNVAQRIVEGTDIEASYRVENVWNGALDFRFLASYVAENSFSPDGISSFDDAGVLGDDASGGNSTPEWRWNLTANYSRENWGVMGQIRYVDGGDLLNTGTPEDLFFKVDDVYYFNLSGRYNLDVGNDWNLEIYGGINNVFDEDPPVAPTLFISNRGTNPTHYDVIGRYFYAGIRATF